MDKKYEALFTPFHIGTCEIKNRVIIPAMEGTNIVDNMIPVYSMMMGKWLHKSPKVFEQARPIVEEIHANGSKIFFSSELVLQDEIIRWHRKC